MSEIAEYQSRITSALDRISVALETGAGGSNDGELAAALDAERTANAQLEERVRAIKEKQETTIAALEKAVADLEAEAQSLKTALGDRDSGLQRMRRVNEELRRSNTALREANAAGLADAHLVNTGMMAELEALRADHATTQAELGEIAAVLDPILSEDSNG
ncbi:MAG: hypothetical protein AAFW64_08505 [Pseudomonadota bacterium]